MQLKFEDNFLEIIETDYPHDCQRCCSQMLQEWLDLSSSNSWEVLFNAIDGLPDSNPTGTTYTSNLHNFVSCGIR